MIIPFRSIRSRLTALYVLLLGVVLILFSVFLYFYLSNRLYEGIDHSLLVSARVMAKTALMRSDEVPFPGLEDFFNQFLESGDPNKFYRIYDGSGTVDSKSKNLDASQFPLTQDAYTNALKGEKTYETSYIADSHPIRVINMPVLRDGKLVNVIQVGTSLQAVKETLKNLQIFLFTAVPAVLVLTTVLGRFMARRALRPVAQIIQTAKEIASGVDLSKRIADPNVKDEIGQLALTLNSMMDRLESSFTQMRQFSSDASHELRTPLTVLKGQSELVLSKERNPEEYQDVLSSNLEEIYYMSKVLDDLFVLSRSDEKQIRLECRDVSLGALIEEVCRHAEVMASGKNIKITITSLEPVHINGDAVKLRQMIWNLLHNGIKYTPSGGEVMITLEEQEEYACLTIQDTGIGIPEEHLPLVFNRFYRVDKARTRKEGGSGLGLSICKYIVEAHQGEIEVESASGKGSKFKIRLPKAEALKPQTA